MGHATNYKQWLARFKRVLAAYQEGLIADDNLVAYQLFLLETGQFNASFDLAELERLNYPKSPFALMYGHSYLRATNTWAMQVLSMIYQEKAASNDKEIYPIWIDSKLFWEELKRYCQVANVTDLEYIVKKLIEEYQTTGAIAQTWWIDIAKPVSGKPTKHRDAVEKRVKALALGAVIDKLDKSLLALFTKIWLENKNPSAAEKIELKKYFPEATDLNGAVQEWCRVQTEVLVKQLKKSLIYYYGGKFNNEVDVLVVFEINNTYGLVNSLGYRADTVRVIRVLLKQYPMLLLNLGETKDFWKKFNATDMIKRLPKEEREEIEELQEKANKIISDSSAIELTNSEMLEIDLYILKNEYHEYKAEFKLYAIYLTKWLDRYLGIYENTSAIRRINDCELREQIINFRLAAADDDLSQAIQAIQAIAEIMQLDLLITPLPKSYSAIVKDKYLAEFPVQAVMLTTYAMRAFVRVLQAVTTHAQGRALKVAVTNQSYYENIENLQRLNPSAYLLQLVRHSKEVDFDSDLVFVEIHPNNFVETKQFAHNVKALLKRLKKNTKPKTVVIDITLNALHDTEITGLLDYSEEEIKEGRLNIIFIQSLTKFAQLGLDKRSAGSVIVLNNGEDDWALLNTTLREAAELEVVDQATEQFFSYFASAPRLLALYIKLINTNVRTLYGSIIDKASRLELLATDCFKVTMSTDPKACYVAINMNGLIPAVELDEFDPFSINEEALANFSNDLLTYLIYPLAEFLNLPLTGRFSIGFPLSSVNAFYDSLRFTIGLESGEMLDAYADIITYITFVLNRQRDPKIFFALDEDNKEKSENRRIYKLRRDYFTEKLRQFKAMTPRANESFFMVFPTSDKRLHLDHSTGELRRLQCSVLMLNGHIIASREINNGFGAIVNVAYPSQKIFVPIRGMGSLAINDPKISMNERRIIVSCLTAIENIGQGHRHNVNLTVDNIEHTLELPSYTIIDFWHMGVAYGPFPDESGELYIIFADKNIYFFHNGRLYDESVAVISRGDLLIPLQDISLEDRAFLFQEGAYKEELAFPTFPIASGIRVLKKPTEFNSMVFFYVNGNIVIKIESEIYNANGVSVFQRSLGERSSCIEIEYWSEKDPIFSRFLRLLTAVYMKEIARESKKILGFGFAARNARYTHFMFNRDDVTVEELVKEAIEIIVSHKAALRTVLSQYQQAHGRGGQYSFYNSNEVGRFTSNLSWPSRYSFPGTEYLNNGAIIKQALALLSGVKIEPAMVHASSAATLVSTAAMPIPNLKLSPLASCSMLSSKVKAPSLSNVLKDGKEVSKIYWYEDAEMKAILGLQLAARINRTPDNRPIHLLGPLDNLSLYGLREALTNHNRQNGMVVIPFNLGNLHWVGLVLEYNAAGTLIRADYYDSQGGNPPLFLDRILHLLRRADDHVQKFNPIRDIRLIRQTNGSDCGPCTIENLLAAVGYREPANTSPVDRRLRHLQQLEIAEPVLYANFYARQRDNRSSFSLAKASPSKKLQSPLAQPLAGGNEYMALIEIALKIADLPAGPKKILITMLRPSKKAEADEHAAQLARIRVTLGEQWSNVTVQAIAKRLFYLDDEALNSVYTAPLKLDYNQIAPLYDLTQQDHASLEKILEETTSVVDSVSEASAGAGAKDLSRSLFKGP